jgi:hypothetical protein
VPDAVRPRRDRTWVWLLAALLLLGAPAVLIAALSDGEHDPARHQPSAPATASSDAADVGMAHVHGLGVDPADDQLYAATHFGVFAVGLDGTAERVGNMQDTMGFTVAGTNAFLASGHPDFAEDDEPLMGLIESTNAGRSWQRLSLRGEADFHALQVVGERLFGFDGTSGTFMTTDDRQRWERLSRVPLFDFAVSRADPAFVVGTTDGGVLRSADGGRTWQPVVDAPALVVVESAADRLVGVDLDGVVHISTDGGLTWGGRGTAGAAPAAVTVSDDAQRVWVATDDARIVRSDDGGLTFAPVYQP